MNKTVVIAGIVFTAAAILFIPACRPRGGGLKEVRPVRDTIVVEFRQTGTVSPRNRLEIKPPLAGRLEDVLVREGQTVKKGEIIAWMSSVDRATLLDAARSKGPEELRKWEETYKPTPILAPLDGFVIARSREPGQTVAASDVILVMADTLIIEAAVDETDLRHIRLGQQVAFSLDAYPGREFEAVVEHIAYESQVLNNVTVYTVKIRPLEGSRLSRAGMTATVVVTAEKKENALLLPYETVTKRGERSFVLVKNPSGKPERRSVRLGIDNGKQVEIAEGLSDEETVLYPLKEGGDRKNRERSGGGSPFVMRGGRH